MGRANRLVAGLACSLVLLAAPARAQSGSATITGTVSDAAGGVLPGTAVTALNEETGFVRTVTTGERGAYTINQLPPGRYSLTLELAGFNNEKRQGIVLGIGQSVTLNVSLGLATLQESVLVNAEAPPVDTTKSAVEVAISPKEVDQLPLVGRRFMDLAQLAPGVSIDNTAANGSADNVAFGGFGEGYKSIWLEGVDVNDEQTTGGTALSNSSRHIFTQESVQEFQVVSNSYSVEFGRSGTGIINILTKSGTNTYHGRGYGFVRDRSFEKPNALAHGKPPFHEVIGGGTLGGPIRTDRVWFFTNFERQDLQNSVTVSVPAFVLPIITDPRTDVPQSSIQNTLFAKLTASVTPKHYLNLVGLVGNFDQTNQDLGGTVAGDGGDNKIQKDKFLSATLTSVLSNNMTNDLKIAVSDGLKNRPPSGPMSPRVDFPSISFGTGTNFFQGRDQKNYIATDVVNLHRESGAGVHDLKLGGTANFVKQASRFDDTFQGRFQFLKDQLPVPGVPSTYPVLYQVRVGDPNLDLAINVYDAFVEDQWRLRPGFTLTAGIRYDVELFRDNNGLTLPTDVPLAQFLQRWVGGDLKNNYYRTSPNDTHDWAPRVSFAWDPANNGKTVVRGGFGLYYDRLADTTRGSIMRGYPSGTVTTYANDFRVTGVANTFFPNMPPLSSLSTSGSTTVTVPNPAGGQVPFTEQSSAGIQRQLGTAAAIGASYIHMQGFHFPRTYNINARMPDKSYPIIPIGTVLNVFEMSNKIRTDQVQLTYNQRLIRKLSFQMSYTWLKAMQYSEDPVDKRAINSPLDWGPGPNDVRHRFVFSGAYEFPAQIQVSGIVSANSAPPYNVITGVDNNGDRDVNDRPIVNGIMATPYSARGDSFFRGDLRLSKRFSIQKTKLEVLWEMNNLFNTVNYAVYQGNVSSVNFGRPGFAMTPFQGQLGVRFDF